MKKLMDRTRTVFLIIMALSLILGIFGIYIPMKAEVEMNVLNNFKLLSSTKVAALTEAIDKSVQGTRSLSSRTMIKNKIVEYQDGMITFDALKAFTEDKYADGVNALENVMYARRTVNRQVLCEIINEGYTGEMLPIEDACCNIEYQISTKNGTNCLEVTSPIMDGDAVIGYDLVGFCLNSVIEMLDQTDIHFEIGSTRNDLTSVESYDNLYEDAERYYYIMPLDMQTAVFSYATKHDLFKRIEAITQRSAVYVVVGYGLMLLFVHFSIISYAKRQIEKISEDRDNYKVHADRDSLTDAFSRLYFETFVAEHADQSCILCMLDLDRFKSINDQYGHAVGDAVLKTFVESINKALSKDDFVVRFGGDEFLVIFSAFDLTAATETIEQIRQSLSDIHTFAFKIDFSYGIVEVPKIRQIYDQIKASDQKMYRCKRDKSI
jgi:diguanylate cyclase (GGDEF)-like protein